MSIPLTHPQNVFKKQEKVNMTDDLVKRLRQWDCGESTWELLESAADRIETLEASESEWQPICDSYAAENQRFNDRIEKLEAALRHCINALREYEMGDDRPRGPIPNDDLRPWLLGAMDNAREALEGKDG
jgi:hypothetical protein